MKILITDKIDDAALDLLRSRGFQLEVEYKAEPEQLEQLASGADGWIIRSGTNITSDLLEKAQHLKVIGRAGVGVDNIEVEAATRKGIAVLNTPTGNTMAAVEHSMAMLLALARHIPEAHQSLVTEGSWERAKFTGVELYGKTIGILGLGKIGARVAARCLAMEMTVLGYDPYLSKDQAAAMNVELVADLDQLFGRCDFLSLHLPSTESTRGLIDGERLKQCKPGVRLVNCARGTLVETMIFSPVEEARFVPVGEASFLETNDLVIGVSIGGESKAYPVRMLAYHHIVNDQLAGEPYVATY